MGDFLALLLVFFAFGYVISRMVKRVRIYGLEGTLKLVFKACGDICFYPNMFVKGLEAWKKGEKYDKEKHFKEWADVNYPDRGETRDESTD